MNRQIFRTARRRAVCLLFAWIWAVWSAVLLSGCAGNPPAEGGLMHFASVDASYTAEFPAYGAEPIVCACERTGGTTVMRVTSPERLTGLSVTYDGSICSLAVGETAVLLSPSAASGLTLFFDLLARTAGGTPSKSPDGSRTMITYADGSVTLDSAGLPIEVEVGERVVGVKGWGDGADGTV
ncbi:MAG: hypothetical protein ACI4V1_00755 [Eubacteriales bacterium]